MIRLTEKLRPIALGREKMIRYFHNFHWHAGILRQGNPRRLWMFGAISILAAASIGGYYLGLTIGEKELPGAGVKVANDVIEKELIAAPLVEKDRTERNKSSTIRQAEERPSIIADQETSIKTAMAAMTTVQPVIKEYGWQYSPEYQDWRFHNGLDIAGEPGQGVYALSPGQVVDVFVDPKYGKTVAIQSGDYVLYYASLANAAVLKKQDVASNDLIGTFGVCNGESSTRLHIAIKSGDRYLDPRTMNYTAP